MTAKRVLVVEDDPDILAMVDLFLTGEGYEVVAAPSGAEALPAAEGIDAIVLDLKMPRMSGVDFARRYRTQGGDAPIIVLSASQDIERLGHEIGAAQVISKPFDMNDLVRSVARAIEARPGATDITAG